MQRSIFFAVIFALAACGSPAVTNGDENMSTDNGTTQTDASADIATEEQAAPVLVELENGLKYLELAAGDGPAIAAGNGAMVHYTGWLYDEDQPEGKGEKFDSSRDRNQPYSFPLGAGRVIQGWDLGVAGMQVGERRMLIIPPELGYGSSGSGDVIPPNATLLFDVELLGIR